MFKQQYKQAERLVLDFDAATIAGKGTADRIGFEQTETKQVPGPTRMVHERPPKVGGIITSLPRHVSGLRTAFNTNGFSGHTGLTGVSFDPVHDFGENTCVQEKSPSGGTMQSLKSYLAVVIVLSAVAALSAQSGQPQPSKGTKPQPPNVKLQPLNVKTGLWESTVTYTRAGQMPIPAGTLARLTPAQRARLEERAKANSGASTTTTHQSCLKKEDLENPDFTDKKKCTWTTLESSSTGAKGSATCDYREIDAKLSGTGEFIVVDQEHINGTIHMTETAGGRSMNTDAKFSTKWLGSSCANMK
jgi:hypothetical protein